MRPDELAIPPEALDDSDAFELLRLWAANGQLHVAINGDLDGGAEDFGELLADLYEHASRMYAQRDSRPLADCREVIFQDFLRRSRNGPRASLEGSMPTEH